MIRQSSHRRPGNVLIWFAITVWTLFALAALVIDLGLVRATQRQMQTAADMGAIEGVRSLGDSTFADETARRESVQQTVAASFNPALGGEVVLEGGIPVQDGFNAAQTLSVAPRYVPNLQLNLGDTTAGDMVRGSYSPSTMAPNEANDYTRNDFTPGGSGAFLVRLRRSNEAFVGSDTSSAGPPIPYLFARGSMMASQSKANGVTIRAASIAAARPVLSVGPTLTTQAIPGVAPFGLTLASWQTWRTANPTGTTLSATVDGTGAISGDVSGAFTNRATQVTVIGQAFTAAGLTTPLLPLDRYVPIYDAIGGVNRIVGFLHTPTPLLSGGTLTIPISTSVAAGNATTVLAGALPALAPADLSSLFSANANITDSLQAPALVR